MNITVTGNGDNGAFSITNGKSEILSYTVNESGTNIQTGGTVLSVASGTNTGSADLDYILSTTQKNAEVAGQYTGTATYEASIVTAHNWTVADENVERQICNQCGADITGNAVAHNEQHLANFEKGGYHSEYKTKYICTDCGAVKYE